MRESLTELLGTRGFEIVPVESAEEALARLARGTFDVVLSDYKLGGATSTPLHSTV